jgi:hypothetical protein
VGGAVFLAIAVLVGIGVAALSWSQVRRSAAPTGGDPAALALALKRVPAKERLGELSRRARPGSWEHELAAEALAAPDDVARLAAMNLALAAVAHALTAGALWPRTGVRIALLGAALCGFAAYVAEGGPSKWLLAIVLIGGVAVFACVEAGLRAARNATRQRRAIDELIAVAFDDMVKADAAPGARALRRVRAGRRARRRG